MGLFSQPHSNLYPCELKHKKHLETVFSFASAILFLSLYRCFCTLLMYKTAHEFEIFILCIYLIMHQALNNIDRMLLGTDLKFRGTGKL